MASLASIINRIAKLEASINLLQDHVTRSGTFIDESKIAGKFLESGLDPSVAINDYERARQASLERLSKQNMGFTDEELQTEFETEAREWKRFAGSYE